VNSRRPTDEPPLARGLLIAAAVVFLVALLGVPLATVFAEAFGKGFGAFAAAIASAETRAAVRLTLVVAAVVVPVNAAFGLAASWAIAKFRFRGRQALLTLIDLPLGVSPVVAGLLVVLVFGRNGLFGPWLDARGLRVLFALPGVVLATLFVTLPYVARQVIPTMEALGDDEEEAAAVLGASGLQTFFRVTLPNVRGSALQGAILCAARAMGEFGAVSVVSGHVRGATATLPLHVEMLYDEYAFQAAFAAASLLTLVSVASLAAKALLQRGNA
jgi:sulfate transport system permease protein